MAQLNRTFSDTKAARFAVAVVFQFLKLSVRRKMFQLTPVTATEMNNVYILDAEESIPFVIYRYVLCRKAMFYILSYIA
jgi:hypothetical protein